MIENALLLDANIAVYAMGQDNPLRDPCRRLLERAAEGEFRAYASTEMIQEFVHHRLRKTGDRALATRNGRDLTAMCTTLAFDREILDLALDLIERDPDPPRSGCRARRHRDRLRHRAHRLDRLRLRRHPGHHEARPDRALSAT